MVLSTAARESRLASTSRRVARFSVLRDLDAGRGIENYIGLSSQCRAVAGAGEHANDEARVYAFGYSTPNAANFSGLGAPSRSQPRTA